MAMGNRIYEADRDGRISIYPALYGSREKGIISKIFKKIVNLLVGRKH